MPKRGRSYSFKQQPFYAVRHGRCGPQIYRTWDECKRDVDKFVGARYKKFNTKEEAEAFIQEGAPKAAPSTTTSSSGVIEDGHPTEDLVVEFEQRKRLKTNDSRSVPVDTRLPENVYICSQTKKLFQRVWTDGSCLGNAAKHTKDMFGGIGVYYGENDVRNISEPLVLTKDEISEDDNRVGASNNKAELMAVVRALEQAPHDLHLDVHTDSQYVIMSCSKWIHGWRKNGWKNAAGKPVQNQKIIKKLDDLITSRKGDTKFTHVKGHSGILENEKADQLAVRGSEMAKYGENMLGGSASSSAPTSVTQTVKREYSTSTAPAFGQKRNKWRRRT